MDATCTIQDSIHVFSLVHKYVSRILGTYQNYPGSIFMSNEIVARTASYSVRLGKRHCGENRPLSPGIIAVSLVVNAEVIA